MKKMILLLVANLLWLMFPACGTETPAAIATEGFDSAALKLGGVNIDEFTIVYAEEGKFSGGLTEAARLADVADALADAVFRLTGKQLAVVSEKELKDELPNEIVIGRASRKSVRKVYKADTWTIEEYSFGLCEGDLVIMGGSANACYFGAMAFADALKAMHTSDFTAEVTKGSHSMITVACVGDSITEGHGKMADGSENDRSVHCYPVYLQRMLGYGYYLHNYGKGGARVTDYMLEPHYAKSLKLQPDVVLLMLGTNDASPRTENRDTQEYRDRYDKCMQTMLEGYRETNADVQVFIMTPPSSVPKSMEEPVARMAQFNREFSERNALPLVEIHAVNEAEKWVFNDSIHPQGEVYKRIAEVIYDSIKDVIKQ